MKKIILICAVMVFGISNISYSIPVHDYGADTDEILIPTDSIQPLHVTFNEQASVSFETISPSSQENIHDSGDFRRRLHRPKITWAPPRDRFRPRQRPNPLSHPSPVPEPATMLLFGSGLIGLAYIRRKGKNNSV